jgi:hypothetical protein
LYFLTAQVYDEIDWFMPYFGDEITGTWFEFYLLRAEDYST